MVMETELHGFSYSVYTWIVRFALLEKSVKYHSIEVNPFSDSGHPAHPFGKVPLLIHNGFRLYETSAIIRYVDLAFPGPSLQPADARDHARADQIISIVDNYAYWPLVRQVSSHGYFNKAFGLEVDYSVLKAGLDAAPKVLSALDGLVAEQGLIKTGQLSLADIHLGPIISYFNMAPEGAKQLKSYQQLSRWWGAISKQQGVEKTMPKLPRLK